MILPVSRLPFWMLYRISDVLFYALYYVAPYRRGVVLENLKLAFPEKPQREIDVICKNFYRHLADLIFEAVKGITISDDEIRRRYRYTNIELLNSYYDKGKSVTILGAHYGNWEWVTLSLPLETKFQTYGIYQQLTNRFMDGVMKRSRERTGMKLVSTKDVPSILQETQGQRITMGYVGDQSPARTGRHHWLTFLNQPTACRSGYEHFAKQYDSPVVHLNVVKVRRGYYEGTFYAVADEPRTTQNGQIIESYTRRLEEIIRGKPEHWLWSHRRWKIKPKS